MISTNFDIDKYRYAVAISTDIDIQAADRRSSIVYDTITPWMPAGGIRAEWHDPYIRHRIAIRDARCAARADRPSVLDRLRAWSGMLDSTPTAHSCEA